MRKEIRLLRRREGPIRFAVELVGRKATGRIDVEMWMLMEPTGFFFYCRVSCQHGEERARDKKWQQQKLHNNQKERKRFPQFWLVLQVFVRRLTFDGTPAASLFLCVMISLTRSTAQLYADRPHSRRHALVPCCCLTDNGDCERRQDFGFLLCCISSLLNDITLGVKIKQTTGTRKRKIPPAVTIRSCRPKVKMTDSSEGII